MTTEREAFEAAMVRRHRSVGKTSGGQYTALPVEIAWAAWQDRAALASLPAPAGEPAMPEPVGHVHSTGDFCQDRPIPATEWPAYLNTADQLRAYGDARAEAARRDQAKAIATKDQQLDDLLQHCPDAECMTCGEIMCPHGEPLHFHHDGCPACYQQENTR